MRLARKTLRMSARWQRCRTNWFTWRWKQLLTDERCATKQLNHIERRRRKDTRKRDPAKEMWSEF